MGKCFKNCRICLQNQWAMTSQKIFWRRRQLQTRALLERGGVKFYTCASCTSSPSCSFTALSRATQGMIYSTWNLSASRRNTWLSPFDLFRLGSGVRLGEVPCSGNHFNNYNQRPRGPDLRRSEEAGVNYHPLPSLWPPLLPSRPGRHLLQLNSHHLNQASLHY